MKLIDVLATVLAHRHGAAAGLDGQHVTADRLRGRDKARVVKTDIAASNGVIHVVDTVLLPPGE